MTEIFIRYFVEADRTDVMCVVERIRHCLESTGACVCDVSVRQYWKIVEYQEVCVYLALREEISRAVSVVTCALGSGWVVQIGGDAVWNHGNDATFVEPLVRWAHVELME